MRCKAGLVGLVGLLAAAPAGAETFLPRAVAPEFGVEILDRTETQRLVGRALLAEPAASALLGEVHLYDRFPYVEAHYVHVTSDARWQRLLYGEPGEAPRAFGRGGQGAGEFGEPRGLAFAPDGRLFVADRTLGRVTVLRLRRDANGAQLEYVSQLDGLQQPMDVAVYDGGTPADPSDDRLLVAEAGAQRIALLALQGTEPVRLSDFGSQGSGPGQFLFPRAVCVGHRDGAGTPDVYVSDAGNHRLARLELRGVQLVWRDAASLPQDATSVDSDGDGNLYLSMQRQDRIWKLSPKLETLALYDGGTKSPLAAPRDVAVPFAWVYDHRAAGSAPAWRGQGTAMVLESWGATTGVRRLDLGVDVTGMRREGADLEALVTDAAHLRAELRGADGKLTVVDLGVVPAGRQRFQIAGLERATSVTLQAESRYDATRRGEAKLDLSAAMPSRVVLRQNVPNPFNPTTSIDFDMPSSGMARLDVFDVRGHRLRTLVQGRIAAGPHRVVWDGRDELGARAGSGLYFYRLQAGDVTAVRKMVLAQ